MLSWKKYFVSQLLLTFILLTNSLVRSCPPEVKKPAVNPPASSPPATTSPPASSDATAAPNPTSPASSSPTPTTPSITTTTSGGHTTTSPSPTTTTPNPTTTTASPTTTTPTATLGTVCGQTVYLNTQTQSSSDGGNGPSPRSWNSVNTAPNEYPWMVYIQTKQGYGFYGVIIDEYYILTTARFTSFSKFDSEVTLLISLYDTQSSSYTTVYSGGIIIHPRYDEIVCYYDYALIRLPTKLDLSTSNPRKICLPASCSSDCSTAGSTVEIASFGLGNSTTARYMQQTKATVVSTSTCAAAFSSYAIFIGSQSVCTGGDPVACGVGAPMMTKGSSSYTLCALLSGSTTGGCSNGSNVYTTFSRVCSVLPWINTVMAQSTTPTPPAPTIAATCGHTKYYNGQNVPGSGIVGGVTALPDQYPWLARLYVTWSDNTKRLCGASIISENSLLTAARCIYISGKTVVAARVFFAHYYENVYFNVTAPGEFNVTATNLTRHPSYNSSTLDFDYGLIRLSQPLNFTGSWQVQKICLPTSCSDGCAEGTIAYVTGWGRTRTGGDQSDILKTAYMPIANSATCYAQYNGYVTITDNVICAGPPAGGVGTCEGDGGGPLMTMENGYYKLCGVVSFVPTQGCALANSPLNGFSRVCSVLPWIKTTAGIS